MLVVLIAQKAKSCPRRRAFDLSPSDWQRRSENLEPILQRCLLTPQFDQEGRLQAKERNREGHRALHTDRIAAPVCEGARFVRVNDNAW
jgi:hypothetical protein